tara:strand:+ start:25159 stop:26433 length:1275 start_codon:yes stop_codon:yes gene_type:complete
MNKLCFLLALSLFINLKSYSQENSNSSYTYSHKHLKSTSLDDTVKLVISLPKDYDTTNTNYPVVYILDGKWFFSQGTSSQTHFSRFKMTPGLIIIGIENRVNQRNWFTLNSKKFNQFLEKELVPFVNKTFRTSDERILFGWEVSGGLVLEVLGTTPSLFTGYLAASPGPLDKTFNERYQYRYEALKSLLKSNKDLNNFLFLTTGKSDYPAQYGVDNLIELLKGNQLENFRWTYEKLTEETHPTTPFKTIHKGIESYFKYYPVLRFRSIEEYVSKGAKEYLEMYYTNRKIKYNFSEERNTSDYLYTCKNIVFTAMSSENYEAFNRYMKEFLPKNMLSITHYNHASMFATFYLKNDNTEMAIKLMTYYTDKFPEAARPYNILGNIYKQLKDKKNARKYYQKAITLGTKNTDRRLSEYKNSLKRLQE